jgi:hypothetical protein
MCEALLPDHLPVLSFKSLRGDGKTTMPYIEAAGARLHVEEHGDGYWPVEAAHHPLIAYQAAFGTNLILQVAAWLWFTWPPRSRGNWRLEQPVLGIRF